MENELNSSGTSEMNKPQTMKYDQIFRVTELFKTDIMNNLSYNNACDIIRMFEIYKNLIPVGVINEIIRRFRMMPAKEVMSIMNNIENGEKQKLYFYPTQAPQRNN